MLQHKQEERELKRYEGDIIKKQHQLRRTMDSLQNSRFSKLDSYTLFLKQSSLVKCGTLDLA